MIFCDAALNDFDLTWCG